MSNKGCDFPTVNVGALPMSAWESAQLLLGLDSEKNLVVVENIPPNSGAGDGYTKAETDALLDAKADDADIAGLQNEVDIIKAVIPNEAAPDNLLADKDYVVESIAEAVEVIHEDIANVQSDVSSGLAQKASNSDLSTETQNRIAGDSTLQGKIDGKQAQLLAGNGIEFTENSDGTITVTAVQDLYVVVDALPDTGIANKIYLLPDGNGSHSEYIWVASAWELIGTVSAEVDLSNYYNKQNVDSLLGGKADASTVYTKTESDSLLLLKANATTLSAHTGNTNNPHVVTKQQVGLGNVNNTSDMDKPVSTLVQQELDGKASTDDVEAITDVIPEESSATNQLADKQYVTEAIEEAVSGVSGGDYLMSQYVGKKLSILGDSMSSFNGTQPAGKAYYYPAGDVAVVGDMYWKQVIDKLGMTLLVNNSLSGGCISSGAPGSIVDSGEYLNLGADPDVILIELGANDYSANVPIGDWDIRNSDPLDMDLTTFRGAYAYCLYQIATKYPTSMIYCMAIPTIMYSKNGIGLNIIAYSNAIKDIATSLGHKVVNFDKYGINFQTVATYTLGDAHPNKAGFKRIAEQMICQFAVMDSGDTSIAPVSVPSSGGGGVDAVNYSTTPVKTGRKWVDRRDEWEVVINAVFPNQQATPSTAGSIPANSTVIDCSMMVFIDNSYMPYPIISNGYNLIEYQISATTGAVSVSHYYEGFYGVPYKIIVKYAV